MKDVIVVAPCTHRSGLLDEYEAQLAKAGVMFHVEQLPSDFLPNGPNDFTMLKRVQFLRSMANRFIDYKVIYATDAWDVLFFGTKNELMSKAYATFLCAAERNCYPEPELAKLFPRLTPWSFANAGLVAGSPERILYLCDVAEKTSDVKILDQAWYNRRLSERWPYVSLDVITRVFYVVSEDREDGSLQVKHGRPWNRRFNTFPNFLHFSGRCPVDGVRRMLENAQV